MNEMQFGNKVRQVLNRGLGDDTRTAQRLKAARLLALERQRLGPSPAMALADNVLGLGGGWGGLAWRLLASLTMAALAAAVIYNWQHTQRAAELEEIDAQLLTDDLPIDAYLDRGFQNWLTQQRSAEQ
jgi:hypothetical protein